MSQLIILTKYPQPGTVKTRLGASIGMEQSAFVQKKCLEKLIETHMSDNSTASYSTAVHLRQSEKIDDVCTEFGLLRSQVFAQQGETLGAIIADGFAQAFERGNEKVIVIGSDLALLSVDHVESIFNQLLNNDAGPFLTVGPTYDGGYYAIGSNSPQVAEIVTDMAYSHEHVARDTIERARTQGFTTKQGPLMRDCDTLADLERHVINDKTGRRKNIANNIDIL